MEFKGTKGKWEVNPRASRNVRCGNVTIANCSSGQNGENEEEEIANAQIIASAPEMFELLKDIVKGIKGNNFEVTANEIEQLLIKITTL